MTEYERLKKQRDEIVQRQARVKAEKIVEDIMTDGGGRKAHRLVMVDPDDCMGAGWSRGPLIDQIVSHLSDISFAKQMASVGTVEDVVRCPVCGGATFIDTHTPASDHPELYTSRHECEKCNWHSDEWPTPTAELTLQRMPIPSADILAALAPVIAWYQSDEQPTRHPLEILRKIVSDLQSDRAAALAGSADKRRLDWMDAHPLKTEVRGGAEDGHDGKAWAIAAHGGNLRETIDAWILSATTTQNEEPR